MNITLVIFSLAAGGAERVIVLMANFWAEQGWTVNLLTLVSGDAPLFYPLHPKVHHEALGVAGVSSGAMQAIRGNFQRVRKLREAIRRLDSDVVISLMSETNVLTLLATTGMRVPVLVQEQNDPHRCKIGRQWAVLRRWTYPRATRVVVLTERSLDFFSGRVQRRAVVIPNPAITTVEPRVPFSNNGHHRTMIAMGRLVPQKGIDMLLRAFARVAEWHPDWSLKILGEGPLRGELESLAASLGLRDRVQMPGTTTEPHEEMRRADLFVMSSRHEGFPLSLCEALACGLPAISFDCPTGPREIIREGVDGMLVPAEDVAALGEAMGQLMGDTQRREALAARAPEVLERFGLAKVMGIWEAAVHEATTQRNSRKE